MAISLHYYSVSKVIPLKIRDGKGRILLQYLVRRSRPPPPPPKHQTLNPINPKPETLKPSNPKPLNPKPLNP